MYVKYVGYVGFANLSTELNEITSKLQIFNYRKGRLKHYNK